jgi:uncharacterized protein YfiM (DUF2279 family)
LGWLTTKASPAITAAAHSGGFFIPGVFTMLTHLRRAGWAVACALFTLLMFSCSIVYAGCLTNDRWHGQDKGFHFMGGAAVSTLVTMHTGRWQDGLLAGAAVGGVKELLDASGAGTCSLQDFAVTVLGSALGAATGHLIVTRVQGRTLVAYVTAF